jgi:SAM-dependent methyltransferase
LNISDIIHRNPNPLPWAEEEKIPWNEPAFSRRMLREHLSQAHDMASRRAAVIEQHVAWIEGEVLQGRRAKILDLGCGPGLYANRLATHGHTVTGIDFSPASIEYARAHGQPGARYIEGDVRAVDFGSGYDLAMMLFGELNVFRPEEARLIVEKAHVALVEGGMLLLEAHTFECVRRLGQAPATWYSAENGVFADGPFVCLMENFWDEGRKVALERFYVLEAGSGAVRRYGQSMQGYGEDEYEALLRGAGFGEMRRDASLTGEGVEGDLVVMRGIKR